jgi:hypothetical protein
MPTLREVREGLAANLDAIPGLQAKAYKLSNSTPPCAWITPVEVDYDMAMQRGIDLWRFTVTVQVGAPTDIGAQMRLDRMLDPNGDESVKAMLEADDTLGGSVMDLRVTRCSGYGEYEGRLGAEWDVEVWASGEE